jgi:hypothetical protein
MLLLAKINSKWVKSGGKTLFLRSLACFDSNNDQFLDTLCLNDEKCAPKLVFCRRPELLHCFEGQ